MHRVLACCVVLLASSLAAAQETPDAEKARLAQWHYDKGLDLMRSEKWDEAAEEFRTAISHDPLLTMAHYNLGQCRMAQKRYVEAVAAYQGCRQSVERQGTLSEKERAARERARQDELNELKESLTRLPSMEVKQGNMDQYRIRIEERIRFLESIQHTKAAGIQVPAEIPLALGSAYFRQQKLEDAEREYQEAIRINGKLGAAHNNLAVIYMLTGRLDEAEAEVKAAEKNGFPVNPRFKEDLKKARAK
jgi:tetratricopeptide (TPR) repeat protein